MITDSIASEEERISVVTFIQADSTYLWRWLPYQIDHPDDWTVQLYELILSDGYVHRSLDIVPSPDTLYILYTEYNHTISDGVTGTLYADISVPNETIDSVLTLVMYRTDDGINQYRITQEPDETYWCPSYVADEYCARKTLQVYLNKMFWDAVEVNRTINYN